MTTIVYDYQTFSLQQYGGISRYFCELASRVDRSPGFGARVVAPVHFNRYLSECDVPQSGIYIPMRVPRTGRLYRAVNAAIAPLIESVHAPSLIHQTYYTPKASQGNVPVVVTVFDMIHELFPQEFSSRDSVLRNKRRCLERADHIVCISESTATDLVKLFGISRTRMSVTHLGYSSIFTHRRPDESTPHARPYLLYVGHRAGYKNFDSALAAYASSRRLADEFDFVAFGGSPLNPGELSRIKSLSLRPGSVVRLTGTDSDLARTYRHAHAFVYPSRYEGFGIPPLEAMSSGCVVACSNVSSIPEVVGDAAALFDPCDIDSIRQALETICFNDVVRSSLLDAGKSRTGLFSWGKCARDTLAVYAQVLNA